MLFRYHAVFKGVVRRYAAQAGNGRRVTRKVGVCKFDVMLFQEYGGTLYKLIW